MIERFVKLEDNIKTSLALLATDATKHISLLTTSEWETCKNVVKVLEPLEGLTRTLSAHKYVSFSSVLVLTKGLKNVYEDMKKKESFSDVIVNSLISKLLSSIEIRLGSLENFGTLTLATFLDPRFKHIMFDAKLQIQLREKV